MLLIARDCEFGFVFGLSLLGELLLKTDDPGGLLRHLLYSAWNIPAEVSGLLLLRHTELLE